MSTYTVDLTSDALKPSTLDHYQATQISMNKPETYIEFTLQTCGAEQGAKLIVKALCFRLENTI